MTEAIRKQEKVFKRLFIFLSAVLGLVFLSAIFPPCDQGGKNKDESTASIIRPVTMTCDGNMETSGCLFRDYLLSDRLFG